MLDRSRHDRGHEPFNRRAEDASEKKNASKTPPAPKTETNTNPINKN